MDTVRMIFPNTIKLQKEDQQQIYLYLSKLVSACSTVIKTNGYLCVFNDIIVMMSADRTIMATIPINPIGFEYVSEIKQFLDCKNNPESFLECTHFFGYIQIYNEILNYFIQYHEGCDTNTLEYKEDDMMVFQSFPDAVASSDVSWVTFSSKSILYRMSISKCLLPINKGDSVGVEIYNIYNDNTRVYKYIINKKKIKSTIMIYTRQFVIL